MDFITVCNSKHNSQIAYVTYPLFKSGQLLLGSHTTNPQQFPAATD